MKHDTSYYKMMEKLEKAGYDILPLGANEQLILDLLTIRRLANKHHKLAEMDCNGVGVIRGRVYYSGMSYGQTPGDYEIREYGYGVKSAYLSKDTEETIFDIESGKVREKIDNIVNKLPNGFSVEFQGDPRGYTVKVFYNGRFLDIQG